MKRIKISKLSKLLNVKRDREVGQEGSSGFTGETLHDTSLSHILKEIKMHINQ